MRRFSSSCVGVVAVLVIGALSACASPARPQAPLRTGQLTHRAHRDLDCPARDVRIDVADTGSRAQAEGCGKRLTYALSCPPEDEERDACRWHPLE